MVSVCDAHCLLYLQTNDNITLSKKGITALKIIGSFIQLLSHQQQILAVREKYCLSNFISIKGCVKSIILINSHIFQ